MPQPIRIGIGIHFSEAIVGAMGPPGSQIITAIGDTVNASNRLESLTTADMTGLDVKGRKLHQALVAGRTQTVEFYALKTPLSHSDAPCYRAPRMVFTAFTRCRACRRDFRVKMRGTSSPDDKLTRDLGNVIEPT